MAAVTDCEMTLQGSFLDSVERSEISVTVGGEPCTERQAAEDDVNTVRFFVHFMHLFNYLTPPVRVLSSRPASRREHRGPSCGKGGNYMCYFHTVP